MKPGIVLDSNVIYSGLRSRRGYSFKILELIPQDKFQINISVPLILEYELVLTKFRKELGLTVQDVREFLDYICLIGKETKIYYLWRPFLRDPYDDHVLEVAVGSNSKSILTFNNKDFEGIEQFGIQVCSPKEFFVERRFI